MNFLTHLKREKTELIQIFAREYLSFHSTHECSNALLFIICRPYEPSSTTESDVEDEKTPSSATLSEDEVEKAPSLSTTLDADDDKKTSRHCCNCMYEIYSFLKRACKNIYG